MKVKIISCQKPSFWYADKIGNEFYVTDHDYRNYKVTPNGHYIRIYDCEILSHTETGYSECIIPNSIMSKLDRLLTIICPIL